MAHTTTFTVLLFSLLSISTNALLGEGGEAGHFLEQAQQAANKGESMDAVRFATGAIENDSKLAFAYYLRGREHFRLGKIAASVADFDQFVELRPDLESRQWERGLSYYYAGQFEKGAKQFELYQTYHDNDVENSVWRFACLARRGGSEKARETILPIRNDSRVPMMSKRFWRLPARTDPLLNNSTTTSSTPISTSDSSSKLKATPRRPSSTSWRPRSTKWAITCGLSLATTLLSSKNRISCRGRENPEIDETGTC